eukprot:7516540-Alexandrium_andersonii.AAC.1
MDAVLYSSISRHIMGMEWGVGEGAGVTWLELLADFCRTEPASACLPLRNDELSRPTFRRVLAVFRGVVMQFLAQQ